MTMYEPPLDALRTRAERNASRQLHEHGDAGQDRRCDGAAELCREETFDLHERSVTETSRRPRILRTLRCNGVERT